MTGTYARVYAHLVWSTWDRLPLIHGEIEGAVYACIRDSAAGVGADVIAIGGVADHVHVLVRYPPTLAISHLVKRMKGASSHLVTQVVSPGEFFKWQGGYGVLSVSERNVPSVTAYVLDQKRRHRVGNTHAAAEPAM